MTHERDERRRELPGRDAPLIDVLASPTELDLRFDRPRPSYRLHEQR